MSIQINTRGKVTIAVIVLGIIFLFLWQTNTFDIQDKISSEVKKASSNKPTQVSGDVKLPENIADKDWEQAFEWVFGLNTWIGYAGIVYANGGFEPNKNSIFWEKYHQKVRLLTYNDPTLCRNAWSEGSIHFYWQTLDALTTEVTGFFKDYQLSFGFAVDKSRGGDLIVARQGIRTMNDLRPDASGRKKKVAFAVMCPSHSLILAALKANDMTMRDIDTVIVPDAVAAKERYLAGVVDAAVIWSPDDEDCKAQIPGTSILWSTEEAPEVITDILPVKRSVVDAHFEDYVCLVAGILEGNVAVRQSSQASEQAIQWMSIGFPFDESLVRATINKARLVTFGDNVNYFLTPGYKGMTGERLYRESGKTYYESGFAPAILPSFSQIFDSRALRAIQQRGWLSGSEHAAEQQMVYPEPTQAVVSAPAKATKKVIIQFATNSSELDDVAKHELDMRVVPMLQEFNNYCRIEGNCDNTGTDAINKPLSRDRAQSVINYLINTWHMPRERFIPMGNGSDNPLPGNFNRDAEERAANRRTEIQLLDVRFEGR